MSAATLKLRYAGRSFANTFCWQRQLQTQM
jgi:hypothetical protein